LESDGDKASESDTPSKNDNKASDSNDSSSKNQNKASSDSNKNPSKNDIAEANNSKMKVSRLAKKVELANVFKKALSRNDKVPWHVATIWMSLRGTLLLSPLLSTSGRC
jgi:hypothetical protein